MNDLEIVSILVRYFGSDGCLLTITWAYEILHKNTRGETSLSLPQLRGAHRQLPSGGLGLECVVEVACARFVGVLVRVINTGCAACLAEGRLLRVGCPVSGIQHQACVLVALSLSVSSTMLLLPYNSMYVTSVFLPGGIDGF